MNILIIGTGYVGLVTGACLSINKSHNITCYDVDEDKINKLKDGIIPIYEDGLEDIVKNGIKNGNLSFTTSPKEAVESNDVIFICVGTPSNKDGSVNLEYIKDACATIEYYQHKEKLVIMKSTVPIGTNVKLKKWLLNCKVVSNPEFLREGVAVDDFLSPDRIVFGLDYDNKVTRKLLDIYSGIHSTTHFMDNTSAEIVKYASNSMLATRLAFMNEIAQLCDSVGGDMLSVEEAVGSDTRIGPKFLKVGPGYGGSCFPKDTRGLRQSFYDDNRIFAGHLLPTIIDTVIESNEYHKSYMFNKLIYEGIDFAHKKVAVLGLAFKPDTDDTRESATHVIIEKLKEAKAIAVVHDPIAEPANRILSDVVYNADIVILMTEWDCYKGLTPEDLLQLVGKPCIIADTRNIWCKDELKRLGFTYYGMGR